MASILERDLRIQTPATMLIVGPTMSGKTYFVRDLINNSTDMFQPKIEKIYYSYKIFQDIFREMRGVHFTEGLDDLPIHERQDEHTLIIIDDQMSEMDSNIMHLFTRGCHHNNISLIFITQNLFCQNKHFRTASLNSHYMVIFKNPRDTSQISNLARQMFPGKKSTGMISAYEDATRESYGYLLIDLKSHTPEILRLRTCVLPNHGEEVLPNYRPSICYRI